MKILKTSLLAIVLLAAVTSCSKEEMPITEEINLTVDLNLANETDWVMADEILALVNEHRSSMGLPLVRRDQQYASAYAVVHTQYMMDRSQINHDNFSERSKALKDRGASSVGENVASGYKTADALVHAWLNSPSHKQVIEGDYTHAGFGVMQNEQGKYYYTQLFYQK